MLFYLNMDSDGNMPSMDKVIHNEHYIKYVNDVPVEGKLPDGMFKIWNYNEEQMYSLHENVESYPYDGSSFLPIITNFTQL